MKRTIILTNFEIYNIALNLNQLVNTDTYQQTAYPVKINFYLQKNVTTFLNKATEIETIRSSLLEQYSADDQQTILQQEINDLLDLQQEVTIYTIDLDAFDQITMTPMEYQALSCMITENYEERE